MLKLRKGRDYYGKRNIYKLNPSMAILSFVLSFFVEEYMKTRYDYEREIIDELKANEYLTIHELQKK